MSLNDLNNIINKDEIIFYESPFNGYPKNVINYSILMKLNLLLYMLKYEYLHKKKELVLLIR